MKSFFLKIEKPEQIQKLKDWADDDCSYFLGVYKMPSPNHTLYAAISVEGMIEINELLKKEFSPDNFHKVDSWILNGICDSDSYPKGAYFTKDDPFDQKNVRWLTKKQLLSLNTDS